MVSELPYRVSYDGDDLIIRFPSHIVDRDQLTRILDSLVLQSMQRKGELTEEQAWNVTAEIDRARERSRISDVTEADK